MGEALKFIIQQFYFSFTSGSIINLYIIYAVFFLEKTKFLPDWLLSFKNIAFLNTVPLFILSAIIIGIFIEGLTDGGILSYIEKRKKYIKHREKEDEFNKLNLVGKIKYLLFMKSTITEACIYYWKQQKLQEDKEEMNIIFKYMRDSNIGDFIDKQSEMVSLIQTNTIIISKKIKNNDVYRFRDLSYMAQLMRFSFLLISLFSFVITACVVKINCIRNDWNNGKETFYFFIGCFILAVVFIILTTVIAKNFSRRYLRELGNYYNALESEKEP
jgi:hypothetical protein